MVSLLYGPLSPIPIIPTAILRYPQHFPAIKNNGTGGSFALVKCNCSNRLTMLMKLAIENTDIEREVSFNMANRGCVMWYRKVKVYLRIRHGEFKKDYGGAYRCDADPSW